MKLLSFLVFFSIVIAIYAAINLYLYIRGLQALPSDVPYLKTGYKLLFVFLASSYLVSRFLERVWISPLTDVLTFAGSVWLAAMVYFLILVMLIDIVRLFNLIVPFLPEVFNPSSAKVKLILLSSVTLIVSFVVMMGLFNAYNPVVNTKDLHIPKKDSKEGKIVIALASDLHLGGLAGSNFVKRFVKSVNEIKPDIILLAGDIASEDTWPLIKENSGSALRELSAPLGVYAITGNHEFIGGIDITAKYIKDQGIILLRDTLVNIDGRFYLAGREDKDRVRFDGNKRRSLKEILSSADENLPVILMDHQPFNLSEAEMNGVDLQVSGHTHDGQLWPFNYITSRIYEVSSGYFRKGNTHYWVSPGYGWWGPPVRTSARPEIAKIILHFE